MPTNALLIRWSGGWHEVLDAGSIASYGRKEALLSLGAQQSVAEVERIAGREMSNIYAKVRQQSALEHRPANLGELPYIGYVPSDTITAEDFDGDPVVTAVLSMTVNEGDDGELQFRPVVGDVFIGVEGIEDRLGQTARKMAAGSLGGQSDVATPAAPI